MWLQLLRKSLEWFELKSGAITAWMLFKAALVTVPGTFIRVVDISQLRSFLCIIDIHYEEEDTFQAQGRPASLLLLGFLFRECNIILAYCIPFSNAE